MKLKECETRSIPTQDPLISAEVRERSHQQMQDAGISGLLRRHRVQHEVRRPEQNKAGMAR